VLHTVMAIPSRFTHAEPVQTLPMTTALVHAHLSAYATKHTARSENRTWALER